MLPLIKPIEMATRNLIIFLPLLFYKILKLREIFWREYTRFDYNRFSNLDQKPRSKFIVKT